MRDPLWYTPITLTLATFGGAALVAVLLVGDRRFFMPRDTAVVAGVAAAALVAALVGVAAVAGWIARLPRPGAADAVLARTVGGLLVNGGAWFLAVFGFAMPGGCEAEAIRQVCEDLSADEQEAMIACDASESCGELRACSGVECFRDADCADDDKPHCLLREEVVDPFADVPFSCVEE
jgi:hypothetical protein